VKCADGIVLSSETLISGPVLSSYWPLFPRNQAPVPDVIRSIDFSNRSGGLLKNQAAPRAAKIPNRSSARPKDEEKGYWQPTRRSSLLTKAS